MQGLSALFGVVPPAVAAFVVGGVLFGGIPQAPVRSGVEVVAVDVHVINRDGRPVGTLGPADFTVTVDGKPRTVVSAAYISQTARMASGQPAAPGSWPVPTAGPGGSRDASRRMYVFAIDEQSLRLGSARIAIDAVRRFIDRVTPADLVGLQVYPTSGVAVDLTTDHASVKRAAGEVQALFERPMSAYHLSAGEVLDIAGADREALARVVARECGRDTACPRLVQLEAQSLATLFEMKVEQSLGGLQRIIRSLREIPGRKTLVLVSGGLLTSDRGVGRAEMSARQIAVGRLALDADITVYALHLDDAFMDAFSVRGGANASSVFRDSGMFATGLEMVAGAAGGDVFRVYSTSPDRAMERILLETSAYYLLGVAPADADRDGKPHRLSVKVSARAVTVRHRAVVQIRAPQR